MAPTVFAYCHASLSNPPGTHGVTGARIQPLRGADHPLACTTGSAKGAAELHHPCHRREPGQPRAPRPGSTAREVRRRASHRRSSFRVTWPDFRPSPRLPGGRLTNRLLVLAGNCAHSRGGWRPLGSLARGLRSASPLTAAPAPPPSSLRGGICRLALPSPPKPALHQTGPLPAAPRLPFHSKATGASPQQLPAPQSPRPAKLRRVRGPPPP